MLKAEQVGFGLLRSNTHVASLSGTACNLPSLQYYTSILITSAYLVLVVLRSQTGYPHRLLDGVIWQAGTPAWLCTQPTYHYKLQLLVW